MTFWFVRAGKYGEREQEIQEKGIIAIGWNDLPDLSGIHQKEQLSDLYAQTYTDRKKASVANHVGQIWNFLHSIKKGDLVATPLKLQPSVAVGEVTGDYQYNHSSPNTLHQRPVIWKKTIMRSEFDQDILYSLGSLLTVGRINARDAESRARDMLSDRHIRRGDVDGGDDANQPFDLEVLSKDRIVRFLESKFMGHNLARLIDGILIAKGYVTKRSPPGPDGGVDILAASGKLGFDDPKICIQVKSSRAPVNVTVLRQLEGVIQSFGASYGILVAWGGLTKAADSEINRAFFRTRLWDQDKIVGELTENYDSLDEELKSEIPLQRIWTVIDNKSDGRD